MIVLDDIPFTLETADVLERLHLDESSQYSGEVAAIVERAVPLARPRAAYRVGFVHERDAEAVVLATRPRSAEAVCEQALHNGQVQPLGRNAGAADRPAHRVRFASRALSRNLREVERVFVYVATCGPELDEIAAGDVFAEFVRDTVKELALWAALAHLYDHLTATFGLTTLASMNPGSGDQRVWPIEQQRDLFEFVGDVTGSIGVALTDSCMMLPNKSVSGVFFPSHEGFENCHLCLQKRCPNRRAAFDPRLWERVFTAET